MSEHNVESNVVEHHEQVATLQKNEHEDILPNPTATETHETDQVQVKEEQKIESSVNAKTDENQWDDEDSSFKKHTANAALGIF